MAKNLNRIIEEAVKGVSHADLKPRERKLYEHFARADDEEKAYSEYILNQYAKMGDKVTTKSPKRSDAVVTEARLFSFFQRYAGISQRVIDANQKQSLRTGLTNIINNSKSVYTPGFFLLDWERVKDKWPEVTQLWVSSLAHLNDKDPEVGFDRSYENYSDITTKRILGREKSAIPVLEVLSQGKSAYSLNDMLFGLAESRTPEEIGSALKNLRALNPVNRDIVRTIRTVMRSPVFDSYIYDLLMAGKGEKYTSACLEVAWALSRRQNKRELEGIFSDLIEFARINPDMVGRFLKPTTDVAGFGLREYSDYLEAMKHVAKINASRSISGVYSGIVHDLFKENHLNDKIKRDPKEVGIRIIQRLRALGDLENEAVGLIKLFRDSSLVQHRHLEKYPISIEDVADSIIDSVTKDVDKAKTFIFHYLNGKAEEI